ncbi:MAG: glycosyltransferase family 2 protein [Isosphaera sp.]|nr:glycosyltransferase family 2 protein [Isosphaera sp.]
MDATSLSLVIPAYNEAAVIARAVREAEAALAGRFADFEVVVVDDGSRDGTAAAVEELAAPHTCLVRHPVNRGYGAALRTGFEAARFPLVAFTDADCQFDLAELGTLAALADEYPIVAGYRVNRKDHWRRRFFSWGYNRLARGLCGTRVRDVDCALKVFRRDALARLLPESRGFFVNTEMMTRARQLGLPLIEVPVTHRPRAGGDSKVSLREVPKTAARLLRFWWANVVFGPRPVVTPAAVFRARVAVPTADRGRVPAPPPSTGRGRPVVPPGPRRAAS